MNILKMDYIIDLIQEAVSCLSRLGNPYELELTPIFLNSLESLQTPVVSRTQQILLLSSVRLRVASAEKSIVRGLIHDDTVTSVKKNSDLVQARLICYKLLNKLTDAIDNLRNLKT
jgi:hypothetical protein